MAREKVASVAHCHDGSKNWSGKGMWSEGYSTACRDPRGRYMLELRHFLTAFAVGSDQPLGSDLSREHKNIPSHLKRRRRKSSASGENKEIREQERESSEGKSRYSVCPMMSICSSLTRCPPPTSWSAIDCTLSGQEGDNNATTVRTFIHQQEPCHAAIPPSTTLPNWMPSPSFS